jgi:hypothetical protein
MLPEISRQILGRMAAGEKLGPIHVSIGEDGEFVYGPLAPVAATLRVAPGMR